MSRVFASLLPGLLLLLASSDLAAAGAFQKCAKSADGRYTIESLLIGCTTDPAGQAHISKHFDGQHKHSAATWVSYDLGAEARADIQASVEDLDKHVQAVTRRVYVEHLYDLGKGGHVYWTFQGELVRKLGALMAPGAHLQMDLYPMVGVLRDAAAGYLDFRNSPYGVSPSNGVDSKDNPFWCAAHPDHFRKSVQPGSAFDTFGGRTRLLKVMAEGIKADPEVMANLPKDLDKPAQAAWVEKVATDSLAEHLKDAGGMSFRSWMRVFYAAKLEQDILTFVRTCGFSDAKVVYCKRNPYNGRPGDLLIEATRDLIGQN